MNMRKFVIGLLLLFTVSMLATDYPIKKINGKSYYVYTVKKGDGIYAIGRKFKVKALEIFKANPDVQSDNIFIGQELLVPFVTEETVDTKQLPKKKEFVDYVVSSGETLYGISQKVNITIDSLIKINPILQKGLKSGLIIQVPQIAKMSITQTNNHCLSSADTICDHSKQMEKVIDKDSVKSADFLPLPIIERIDDKHLIRYKVKKSETLYFLSNKFNVAIDDIIAVNPILKEGLRKGQIIYIPKNHETVSLAMALDSNIKNAAKIAAQNKDSILLNNIDSIQVVGMPNNTMRIALLLPFNSRTNNIDGSGDRFIDFYKGFLIAAKSARDNGQSLEVFTYDVGSTTEEIDSILAIPSLKTVDCIIGPAYSTQLPQIEEYAKENEILTLVPFSSKLSDCNEHPYILQFNPCRSEIYSRVASDFIETHDYHYIIADIYGSNNKGSQFQDIFETTLKKENLEYDYLHLSVENVDTLKSMVQSNTMLIIGSSDRKDVASIVDKINLFNLDNLTLWGFMEWKNSLTVYDRVYYLSLFNEKTDYNYLESFTHWFSKPAKGLSIRYDMLGYDALVYLMHNWHKTDHGMSMSLSPVTPKYLISQPNFKLSGDHSYVNYGHFIFYYNGITTNFQAL